MKSLYWVLMTLLVVVLSACGHDQNIIYRDRTVLVVPDDDLIKPCEFKRPPSKKEYLAGDADKREEMLTNHIIDQDAVLRTCNGRFATLRKWKTDKEKLYNKPKEP